MSLAKKEVILIPVVVLLCALAVFLWMRSGGDTEANAPGGVWYVCKECKHEFNLSVADIAEHHQKHYGEPIPCPKCKGEAVRAEKCPHCGKVSVIGQDQTKCPSCGKPF